MTILFLGNIFLHYEAITGLKSKQIHHLPSAGELIIWNSTCSNNFIYVTWDVGFYAILFHVFLSSLTLFLCLLEPVFWAASFLSMSFEKTSFVAVTDLEEFLWLSVLFSCVNKHRVNLKRLFLSHNCTALLWSSLYEGMLCLKYISIKPKKKGLFFLTLLQLRLAYTLSLH